MFGNYIKKERKAKNIALSDAVKTIGISIDKLKKIENGEEENIVLNVSKLGQIAQLYDCSFIYLCYLYFDSDYLSKTLGFDLDVIEYDMEVIENIKDSWVGEGIESLIQYVQKYNPNDLKYADYINIVNWSLIGRQSVN